MRFASVVFLFLTMPAGAAEFTAADVPVAEETVRKMYANKPCMVVQDVTMLRIAPERLTGFAHVKIGKQVLTVTCAAQMGLDAQYLVTCE